MTPLRLRWLPLLACAASAGGAGAASPSMLAAEPIRFGFQVIEGGGTGGTAGNAFLDIGPVSAAAGRGRSRDKAIVVTRRIAVRLEGMAPTARVSVALLAETPGCTIRLNGLTLSSVPRLVDPVHRVGSTVVHQLEMSIPASVPAGPLLSNLQWLAETD